MKRLIRSDSFPVARRTGVTLTEVLVSLMIMSIGLTLVASLFPIAALRTLQASQMTNATILRKNAESLITMMPNLVFDPDQDGNLAEHFQIAGQRNYVVDPIGFYTHNADGNAAARDSFGGLPRFGGGLHILQGISLGTTDPAELRALRLLAQTLAQLGDGWTTQYDGIVSSVRSTAAGVIGLELPADANLSDIPFSNHPTQGVPFVGATTTPWIPDPETSRIVVYSGNGEFSQSFPLTQIDVSGRRVYWSEDINEDGSQDVDFDLDGTFDVRALPNEFFGTPGNLATVSIGRVLLQTKRANDYSWMLSVRRRSDGLARSIDVVIRHSDGVDVADEATFPVAIRGDTTSVGLMGTTLPAIRKGGFMFDPENAVWHRIRDIQPRPAAGWPAGSALDGSGTTYSLLITLEDPVRPTEGSGSDFKDDGLLNGSDVTTPGTAIFPKGIVDVYPLGSRQIPDRLR